MKIHIVQKGDTLFEIAKNYGVNFEEIVKLNSQLSSPDMIMPGMKIKIPSETKQVKSATDKTERIDRVKQEAKTTERPIGEMNGDDLVEPKSLHVKIPDEYKPLSSVKPIPKTVRVPEQVRQMADETNEVMEKKQVKEQEVQQVKTRREGTPCRPMNDYVDEMPKPNYARPISHHCCCCCQNTHAMYAQRNPSPYYQRGPYYGNPYMTQHMHNQMPNVGYMQYQQMSNMPNYDQNQMPASRTKM